ncbi:MAG: hypothetical protein ACLGIA_08955 [Actinomycetes bacterium]
MIAGLLAAVVGALGYGFGSVLQGIGASRASGPLVMRQPAFVAGLALDGLAWLSSLVALRFLPVYAVQSLLAGSLAVTVLVVRLISGTPMRRRDLAAVVVIVLALATVAGAAGHQSPRTPPAAFGIALLVSLAAVVVVLAVTYARGHPVVLAALAGVAFSGAALSTRAVHASPGHWTAILFEPLALAVLGFGLVGTLAYARSLESGAVGTVTAVLWVVEVALPAGVGVLVLQDGVRRGWAVPAFVAAVAALAACCVLATSPAQSSVSPQAVP